MQLILITFAVNVLLCWAAASLRSKSRARGQRLGNDAPSSVGIGYRLVQEIRKELLFWLIVIAVLVTLFLLLLIYSYSFGPLLPIHEWGK